MVPFGNGSLHPLLHSLLHSFLHRSLNSSLHTSLHALGHRLTNGNRGSLGRRSTTGGRGRRRLGRNNLNLTSSDLTTSASASLLS